MKYITDTGWSYWVRFYEGNADNIKTRRKCIQKSFAFSRYGGKDQALELAKQWRDEQCEILERPLDDKVLRVRRTSKNETGIPGVCRIDYIRTYNTGTSRRVLGYSASWCEIIDDESRYFNKMFIFKPDDDIDERNAFRLAKALRNKMVRLHYKPVKSLPRRPVSRR